MMNKKIKFWTTLFVLAVFTISQAGNVKWVKVGNLWDKIIDSGDQGYGGGAYTYGKYYYNAFTEEWQVWDYRRMGIACKNWTSPEGEVKKYKMTGFASSSNEQTEMMPLPDAEGVTIHRYCRYSQPKVTVDGMPLEEPFPRWGDEVAPEKIPGTADMMIESRVRTSMGVDIIQKVFTWSQKNHDDYILYDWTLVNTGNVDLDDEVELPNQTLDSLFFYRSAAFGWLGSWLSYYGSKTTDSLRLMYNYPSWAGGEIDDFGTASKDLGFIQYPWWQGWALLHVDKSADDRSDDPNQPRVVSFHDSETQYMRKPPYELSDEQMDMLWTTMKEGIKNLTSLGGEHPYMQDIGETDLRENTYHEVPMDVMAARLGVPYANSWEGGFQWVTYRPIGIYSCGPYTLAPGDSIRFVWAQVMGSISPEMGWSIGKDWRDGKLSLNDAPDTELPPVADLVYSENPGYDDNDKAKDKWVCLGKDSLFNNASFAKWALNQNYQVPVPPPPPSINVNSRENGVEIAWFYENESEVPSDLAGFRVYRALGSPYYSDSTQVLGKWEKIYEGDKNSSSFIDTEAQRGMNYFYYVAAYDDGTHPEVSSPVGALGVAESLESGMWLNYTRTNLGAASLKRESGKDLDAVRVVPNPYNAQSFSDGLHYTADRKIMFLNLPPVCTIKIYTETGDLVKTIEHTDHSGDEEWVDPTGENYMNSSSSQIPVSGIYIAHIETPDGKSVNKLFVIVR